MLIYIPETEQLITAIEGTGDNLLPEDEADGFVDYFLTSLYQQNGEDIDLLDSGQLLSSEYIADLTLEEQVARLLDYWELAGKEYQVINKER